MNQITSSAIAPIIAVFESASSIRIILIDNEPWFVAVDVCSALNIQNASQACAPLDDDERSMFNIGRQGNTTIINESGLFTLILRCRDAVKQGTIPHKFRKWVTSEVLPSIRKTGGYVVPVAEPEPQYEEDAAIISEVETERLKKMVGGIAYCLPTMTTIKVAAAIYGRIKSPLRIGRIDDLPAPYFDRTMQYLERVCADARQHNRKQSAADEAFLNKIIAGCEVAA